MTKQKIQNDEFEESIKFWCLKPSVAFTFFKECHSVILCSGTLSPSFLNRSWSTVLVKDQRGKN